MGFGLIIEKDHCRERTAMGLRKKLDYLPVCTKPKNHPAIRDGNERPAGAGASVRTQVFCRYTADRRQEAYV